MANAFKLTSDQKEVSNLFSHWYRKQYKQVLEIAGFAGVGKSTILPMMIREAGLDLETEVMAMAYTGRAASNLTLKGLPASSMHSSLMELIEVPKLDENGNSIVRNGRVLKDWKFVKKQFLPKSIKLLIVEEGSFCDETMGKISESFDIPIYVTGDNGQLGPPFGRSYFLNNPDYLMTQITRQAENSGIIELATRIREGKEIPDKRYQFKNDAFILPKKFISNTILLNTDMILCAKNKTRNFFNKRIRNDLLGIDSKLPVKGDKIICRNNYWNRVLGGIPLTNGTIGEIINNPSKSSIDLKSNTIDINFKPEYSLYDYYEDLPLDITYFQEDCGAHKETYNPKTWKNKGIKMELGHAMTTYISQGSEFPSVLYWDEIVGDEETMRRLRYTAATRASEVLMYAI